MELDRQRAVVVGGSSGVGHATASLLVAHGAEVTITSRSAERAAEAAGRIGSDVRPAVVDLTDQTSVERFASDLDEVDILVVTAGETHFAPTEHEEPSAFVATLDTNLQGTFSVLRSLAPKLADGARVVLTTTVLADRYFFGATALSASRAGVRVVLTTFAAELVGRGIRVNAVSLGPIETEAWTSAGATDDDKRGVASAVPLGRLGRPAEVAEAALFLVSERSSFVHAHELVVDGGWASA